MAEVFEGVESGLAYSGEGGIEKSCQAVNFATLFGSAGYYYQIDHELRKQGLTDENGMTTLPTDGGEVDLGFIKVELGPQEMYFKLDDALVAAQEAFSDGRAIQFSTMIPGSDGEPVMHPILFVGHNKNEEQVSEVFVGDSRTDGVSEITPEFAMTILEVADDDIGVIIGQTLKPIV